jgi:hypothetical protein
LHLWHRNKEFFCNGLLLRDKSLQIAARPTWLQ